MEAIDDALFVEQSVTHQMVSDQTSVGDKYFEPLFHAAYSIYFMMIHYSDAFDIVQEQMC